jgi:hypothetical protein
MLWDLDMITSHEVRKHSNRYSIKELDATKRYFVIVFDQ